MTERVWITGASQGIGAALALTLARRGKTVIASARSSDKLAALANGGETILTLPLDVTDAAAVAEAVERIETDGPIDTAVLNAGSHRPVDGRELKAKALRELVELNLFGVANCLEALIPRMVGRGRGRIAVVASLAGYRGLPTAAYYAASKAAVIALAEALRFDLVQAGIMVQVINPGFVRTPLTDRNEFPMPFRIEAEAAARIIADGLESARFEIAFPMPFALIMKTLRLLPYGLYFPLVARATRQG